MKEVFKLDEKELVNAAIKAAENSYCPYSHFGVGAALLCESGRVYTGCNIENSSYSLTNCAERTAFFSATANGEKGFLSIAVVGGHENGFTEFCPPCGACRQVMSEFCNDDFKIIMYRSKNGGEIKTLTLTDLLPHSFVLDENLGEGR